MKFRKSMIIVLIAIFIFTVSATCAAETDNTLMAVEDNSQMELSVNDNIQTSEKNNVLAQNNNEENLGAGEGTYSDLSIEIGNGGDKNLTKSYYKYNGEKETIKINTSGVINGNGAIIDMANSSNMQVFNISVSGVIIKNLTIKNANFNESGGAIYFSDFGTVMDCVFENNQVTGDPAFGGAIFFYRDAVVENCIFNNNQVINDGGAIFINGTGNVTNCVFTKNKGVGLRSNGGAIYVVNGTVLNCSFNNNLVTGNPAYGAAVYFEDIGNVLNCNFTNNIAMYGAVKFNRYYNTSSVKNCIFINNSASNQGGAIHGAVATISNCYFTKNNAITGGAIFAGGSNSNVTNCIFIANTAHYGGAVRLGSGNITNCNLTDNTAYYGGAVYFLDCGNINYCNFTGNNATTGSAIYFYKTYTSTYPTISNTIFLNNRADADSENPFNVTITENNITIIFIGQNNLLNAMYYPEGYEAVFYNVTYWGVNGVTTITGNLSGSNREVGQNITVGIVMDDILLYDNVSTTDSEGKIVLDAKITGKYYIRIIHVEDSYYAMAEKIITNMKLYVNVTSQTTTNRTVNITAKSDIPPALGDTLLFILSNNTNITANYAGDGIWWAVYEFGEHKIYEISAQYSGVKDILVENGTISIGKAASTLTVNDIVFDYGGTGYTSVLFTNATGVVATIIGQPRAVVNVINNTIIVSGLNAGTFTLTVSTVVDDDHNSITKNVRVTVNKLKTQLSAADVTTTFDVNKYLVITLKDEHGNLLKGISVSVNLNGAKIYSTDSNGQIKVPTKGLVPNSYVAKIIFNGDNNYLKSTKDVKVTIKKLNSKITAAKKTFSVKTQVKNYAAVLKDSSGKAIKSVKLTLKVGGKTYSAKTNSAGKAVFKITHLTKKGSFNAVVKFDGNKYYNKASKSVKLTVK